MSLRPRYSLLTLLVLTAFVAGGVKLWYGPHQMRYADIDPALLDQLGYRSHVNELGEFDITLEYINHFDRREYVAVFGTALDDDDLHLFFGNPEFHISCKRNLPFELTAEEKAERIVRWCCWFPDAKTINRLQAEHAGPCGNSFYSHLGKANQLYLISNQGRIFTSEGHSYMMPIIVNLIDSNSISDPAIRSRLQTEAANYRNTR